MQPASDRQHRQSDSLDPARANAFLATLGDDVELQAGDALPPFFHQLYFWDARPPGALGRDGHPRVGGLIPDMGLPRRMWAGGRLRFDQPLRLGHMAEKVTTCETAQHKTGRSGPLGFVTMRHEIWQEGTCRVTEWQDLVYRAEADPSAQSPSAPTAPSMPTGAQPLEFDTTLLFRYSALTFNGHRIHYDADYARTVEGYDGLVVHGPLLAQLMMLAAQDVLGPLRGFAFRGRSPLTHNDRAFLCRDGHKLWIAEESGRLIMDAEAEV